MARDAPLRVLHVIESFGGGSLSALFTYVANTPELEHHIAFRPRPGEYVPDGRLALFASAHELGRGYVRPMRDLRRIEKGLHPDVIHAHSSFAGAYVRLAMRATTSRRIVYTPHCYAFERLDLALLERSVYWALEYLLAWNTSALAACSERELYIGGKLPYRRRLLVPNIAADVAADLRTKPSGERLHPEQTLTAIGRLSRQKAPDFFARVVRAVRERRPDVRAQWIGDGPVHAVRELEQADIDVTGWLSRERAAATLSLSDTYVHTAAWEGFPLAVLEAHAVGLPIVCRRIPALAGAPSRWQGAEPDQLASRIVDLLDDRLARAENRMDWGRYLRRHTAEAQRERLLALYGQEPVTCDTRPA